MSEENQTAEEAASPAELPEVPASGDPSVEKGETPSPPAAAPEEAEEALSEVDLAAVEAILFATDSALSPAKIAEVASIRGGRKSARRAIESLNTKYEQMGCAFRIESLAGGYQMLTLPEYNGVVGRLLKVRSDAKLSQAALETLAIIAYKQPILRADIEGIRGVASGEMIRSLMEKGLVKIVGRADEIGRPMLYGTTKRFLEVFGMADLKDLPQVAELASGANPARPKPAAEAPVATEKPPADAAAPAAEPTEAPEASAETDAPSSPAGAED